MSDREKSSRAQQLLGETERLKKQVYNNIEKGLESYGALDELDKSSEKLVKRASKFRRKSIVARQQSCWASLKLKIRIAMAALAGISLLAGIFFLTLYLNNEDSGDDARSLEIVVWICTGVCAVSVVVFSILSCVDDKIILENFCCWC